MEGNTIISWAGLDGWGNGNGKGSMVEERRKGMEPMSRQQAAFMTERQVIDGRQARVSKLEKATNCEGNQVGKQHRMSAAWRGEESRHGSEEKAGRSPGLQGTGEQAAQSFLLTCSTIVL